MLRLSGGRRLQSPAGDTARPTPSRVRLAVMNMLSSQLLGARWLDLCCGSGVMGCEALQRGAIEVLAIDQDRRIAATAQSNLELVAASQNPPGRVKVVQQHVLRWLTRGNPGEGFDLIYADPPYSGGLYEPMAQALANGQWLKAEGLLLMECSSAAVPEIPGPWLLQQERRYGSTTVLLLQQT